MKIRNVEVPHPIEDGTESASSEDILSSSSNHAAPAEYEKTVASFTAAMTELQQELRDKTTECEALYQTANALSGALKQSDQMLQEKTLECERLSMKLQMVTFVERDDEVDPLGLLEEEDETTFCSAKNRGTEECNFDDRDQDIHIPQRPAAMLDEISFKKQTSTTSSTTKSAKGEKVHTKSSKKKGGHKSSSKSKVEPIEEDKLFVEDSSPSSKSKGDASVSDGDGSGRKKKKSSSGKKKEGSTSKALIVDEAEGPVSVDDQCNDDGKKIADGGGPRQAHFYHVIMERDMAQQTVKKLNRELRHARSKVRDLKAKLGRSTALNELSVSVPEEELSSDSHSSSNLFGKKQTVDASTAAAAKQGQSVRRRSWFPGIGGNHNAKDDSSDIVEFVTEAEMSVKSRRRRAGKQIASEAAAEHEYLKAIAANDADRAGGYQQVRCDI